MWSPPVVTNSGELLTSCTKSDVSRRSARFIASAQVESPYRVLKSRLGAIEEDRKSDAGNQTPEVRRWRSVNNDHSRSTSDTDVK